MNYQTIPQRQLVQKPSYIPIPSPIVQQQKIIPNQYGQPLQIVPTTEIIRILPPEQPQQPIQDPNSTNGLSVPELKSFLEDLMKRYDKLAQELQKATSKEIQLQNQFSLAQTEFNNKLLQFQQEREVFQQALNNKDQEINFLNQEIEKIKENHFREIQELKKDNEHVAIVLTDKLDQMNQFAKEKMIELDQQKSLLLLREQEVQEWRNRKNNGDVYSQEINQLKQKIYLLQQEKEQLIDRLRYQSQDNSSANENQMLKAQLLEKEQEVNTLKLKLQYGQSDQRLLQELEQAKQEIQYYQQQLLNQGGGNGDHLEEIEDLRDKNQILENEINRLNRQLTEMRHELEDHKNHKTDNDFLRSKLSSQQNQMKEISKSQLGFKERTPQYY